MKTIPLTDGGVTLVDDRDFEKLRKCTWVRNDQGYVLRTKWVNSLRRSISFRMHREIMGVSEEFEIDHIDGNRANNQRSNLRVATHAENLRNRGKNRNNTSGFKGAFLQKLSGRYFAQICVDRRRIYLGTFNTPEEAHAAYMVAAHKYHKEFARA
jgi:hypothetical protein